MISLKVLELSHWQIDRQSETWTQWLHTLLDIMMVSRDLLWELNATLRVFAWNRTRILCITAAQQVKSIHQTQCMPTVHTLSALSHSVINFHHFTHKYTTINLQQEHPQRTMTFLVYSVSHNPTPPPEIFWHFSPNGWKFLVQILRTYYTFLSMLDYKFLFNYLQLWQSYAILSIKSYTYCNFHINPTRNFLAITSTTKTNSRRSLA